MPPIKGVPYEVEEIVNQVYDDSAGNIGMGLRDKLAGEDLVNDVQKVEERWQTTVISTATTTTIKSTAGRVKRIVILGLGAITAYDNTAASGTILIPTFTPNGTLPSTIALDTVFSTGLTIVTGTGAIVLVHWN